jgi:hypothetical protein
MIDIKEVYWAAGFIEGEGTFSLSGANKNSPVISAKQVNLEPLCRIKNLFGGKIHGPYRRHDRHSPCFNWTLSSRHTAGTMMMLWPLMSEKRRRQMEKVLSLWRASDISNVDKKYCIKGHEFTAENTYTVPGKIGRHCITCIKLRQTKWYDKRRKPVETLESIKTDVSN